MCFFPYQTICQAASGKVLSQSLAPNLRSRHVTIKLLAVPGSAPNPPAGPAPQPHPPSLITRGLASRDVASPLPLPASPRFYYLLAVHFQIDHEFTLVITRTIWGLPPRDFNKPGIIKKLKVGATKEQAGVSQGHWQGWLEG